MTAGGPGQHDGHMLLTEFRGTAEGAFDADADAVFAALTDIDNLPLWNRRIAKVLRTPNGPMEPGVRWCVTMSVPPASWPSKSRCTRYDVRGRVFAHISQSDDGNPSFGEWTWTVTPAGAGARARVEWIGHPKTFWRRLLFARIRAAQLQRETEASLTALAYHLTPRDATV
jgi:uncharacterized protein YndB with AHSA1/START domain